MTRIGITTSLEAGEQRLSVLYVRAVERAGALPVVVPMPERERTALGVIDNLDGLVVTGGPAVTDGLIGELPADLSETDPERVRWDRFFLEEMLRREKPVLGICYGMQLLNALEGGTIFADVEKGMQNALVHSNRRGGEDHAVAIAPGSMLHEILEQETLSVNSRHVQAVATVGRPYRVSATAPDGIVEAIEWPERGVLGVQFHPERMDEALPLFRWLVSAAEERRSEPVAV